MKKNIFLTVLMFSTLSFASKEDSSSSQTLKELISNCLHSGSYIQIGTEKLTVLTSIKATAKLGCVLKDAEQLYDYIGRYTDDESMRHEGNIVSIERKLSEDVWCSHDIHSNHKTCFFNLNISEEIIDSEEK